MRGEDEVSAAVEPQRLRFPAASCHGRPAKMGKEERPAEVCDSWSWILEQPKLHRLPAARSLCTRIFSKLSAWR
eukprot:399328-Hanusia_phi.AAC.3